MKYMYNVFAKRRWVGTKLYWAKKVATDSKAIIITMYCWICNINRYTMHKSITKCGKK